MKKVLLVISALVCALAIAFTAGCNADGGLTKESYAEAYNAIADARVIKEKIEISNGGLKTYIYTKTYTLAEGQYSISEVEKTRNKIETGDEDEYTETQTQSTAQKTETPLVGLNLDEENFDEIAVESDALTAKIKDGKLATVLGITETLPAATQNAGLVLTMDSGKLSQLAVSYTSDSNSAVSIKISFTY